MQVEILLSQGRCTPNLLYLMRLADVVPSSETRTERRLQLQGGTACLRAKR